MTTEVKNSNNSGEKSTSSGPQINNYNLKLPIRILLTLRQNALLKNPIHPIDLMTAFGKTKSRISKAYKPLTDDNFIKKTYGYETGVSKNYLTLEITDSGMVKAEELLKIGLTDDEWSRITNQSPVENPAPVKPKSEPIQEPTPKPMPSTPAPLPFKKIKKELFLKKIIELIKKDANDNLLDNYESAARDETVAGIMDETMDIFQNNLFAVFEGLDVVKFAK